MNLASFSRVDNFKPSTGDRNYYTKCLASIHQQQYLMLAISYGVLSAYLSINIEWYSNVRVTSNL